jgi:hypothetical protein
VLEPAPAFAAPVPPRRPEELGILLAAAPMPPSRPVSLATLGGSAPLVAPALNGQMRTAEPPARVPAAGDDRAALRALFEAAATPTGPGRRVDVPTSRARLQPLAGGLELDDPGMKVRMVFSSANLGVPSAEAFSGPAVAPLPVLR